MQENIADINRNPIYDVYDQYRTARFNVRYYECQLNELRIFNFIVELLLAFSASTGFATLWIWNTTFGEIFWKVLLAIAAVLALARPLFGLSDKIQQNSEVLMKWRSLDGKFQIFTLQISQYKKYSIEMRDQFVKLVEEKISIKEPEKINNRIRNKCFKIVNKELPITNFYVPEVDTE